MSQPFPPYPGAGDPRFDPYDPLVSADYSGWWQRSTALVRRAWRTLLLVQLCTAVPALVLVIPAQVFIDLASNDLQGYAAGGPVPDWGRVLPTFAGALPALLIAGFIYSIGTVACARVVAAVAVGRELTPGQALRSVLNRVPALIGWSVVGGLLGLLAFVLCILPVFYVAAVLVILPVVVLFEPGNGIDRCFKLFHVDLGAAVARVVTIAAVSVGVSIIFGVLSTLASLAIRGPGSLGTAAVAAASSSEVITDSIAGGLISGIGTLVTAILITPMIVAAYADLRARHEPFVTAYLPQP